jgi:uncharacterized protein
MSVLVDSNVLVAATDRGEARHARAKALLEELKSQGPFTTDHVLIETWGLLRRRGGYESAERFLAGLRGSPIATEQATLVDLERAQAIGELWRDQEFDLVGRTSMAVMERLGCSRAATFDRDFAVYRYGPDRRLAFEVLQ